MNTSNIAKVSLVLQEDNGSFSRALPASELVRMGTMNQLFSRARGLISASITEPKVALRSAKCPTKSSTIDKISKIIPQTF
jgi:hypothetical protein